MTQYDIIRELRAVAKKHEGKHLATFETNINAMATDAANHIERLCDEINRQKAEIEELKQQIEDYELEEELKWEREVMLDGR